MRLPQSERKHEPETMRPAHPCSRHPVRGDPVLLPLVALALLQGVPGHRYTFRMTSHHDDPIVGTVREDGRSARIDFDNRQSGDREFMLVRDGQLIVVHPDDREYSVMEDSTEEFSVEVRAFGIRGDAVRMRVVTDYWVTAEPLLVHNPLIEMLSRLGSVLGQSDPAFVRQQIAARRALLPGTPLRIVVTTWTSDRDEHDRGPEVQTIEISDVTRTRVDPAIFRIPEGLTRREGDLSWRF
jgi:hypothetical protein